MGDYCKPCRSRRNSAYLARWKATAQAALGGACMRCEYADLRALQIDHVNGGGRKERREDTRHPASYYQEVIREADSGKYQLLCANCNWIKYVEGLGS